MTDSSDSYASPLATRYASAAMQRVFTARSRAILWRRLWATLAECQAELGFPVTVAQAASLRSHAEDIDLASVARYESETRHEVIAHIRAFGDLCPDARPIIHLGATSAFVMDNSDLMQIRDALALVEAQLVHVISALRSRALELADLPVLGFTHFQPAQLTTFGKRICLWMQDLLWDLQALRHFVAELPFLGMKGATGTQASLLELCDNDEDKVRALDKAIAARIGFSRALTIAGQTYPRKIDSNCYHLLASIAQSAAKMATDLRLMQHDGEAMEPFRGSQVGSSAMPYKRNPMACERVCALSRFLLNLAQNGYQTASAQWLERSLDDSANKRLVTPEAFMATDAILQHLYNIAEGFEVVPGRIRASIDRNLPFIATENIMMAAVKAGGDRQALHEAIRVHSMAASRRIMDGAENNDLLTRLAADPAFAAVRDSLSRPLDPAQFVGLAPQQTRTFIAEEVDPALPAPLPAHPWETGIEV